MDAKQRQAALHKLAEYQKSKDFDFDVVAASVANESDRGMVVVLGSLTEDLLLKRILQNFVPLSPEQEKQLTRGGGVLSTWADRAAVARALGIIDDEDLSILDSMKAMRNACAHSRRHIDFDTKELRDVLCSILGGDAAEAVQATKHEELARAAFILAASFIWGRIKGESNDQANGRVQKIFDEALAELGQKASLRRPRQQSNKDRRPAPKGKTRQRPPTQFRG